MKKLIRKITFVAIAAILIQSCSGFLDTAPSHQTSSETALLTIRDAHLAVNGLYNMLKRIDYYGHDLITMGDNRGDDLQPRNSNASGTVSYAFRYTSEINTNWSLWNRSYNQINRANSILESWERLPAPSADDLASKNEIKGHALIVRALSHFHVALCYGYPYLKDNGASLGAVIVDKTLSISEGQETSRATVAQTYEFILSDVEEALPLLFKPTTLSAANSAPNAANNIPGRIGKFNYWSAKLFQARVYLYMGQWEKAYYAAKEVIDESPYSLVSNANYETYLATQGGSETILELIVGTGVEDMDGNGNNSALYRLMWHTGSGSGQYIPTQAWLDLMAEDPDDVRSKVISVGDGIEGYTWIKKFPGVNGQSFLFNNPRVFRLIEAYFIAAESALSMGRQSEADQYLDVVRKRANPSNVTILCTVDDILKERRKEFIGEGHRFYDMMRLGRTITRSGGFHFAHLVYEIPESYNWDFYKVVLPISRSERLIQPSLQQNPGYID